MLQWFSMRNNVIHLIIYFPLNHSSIEREVIYDDFLVWNHHLNHFFFLLFKEVIFIDILYFLCFVCDFISKCDIVVLFVVLVRFFISRFVVMFVRFILTDFLHFMFIINSTILASSMLQIWMHEHSWHLYFVTFVDSAIFCYKHGYCKFVQNFIFFYFNDFEFCILLDRCNC